MFTWCWHKWKRVHTSWVEVTLFHDRFHSVTGKKCTKCGKVKGKVVTEIL